MSRRFQFSLARVFASVSFAAIACGLFRFSLGYSHLPLVAWLASLCGTAFIGASIGILWREPPQGAAAVALVLVSIAVGLISSRLF